MTQTPELPALIAQLKQAADQDRPITLRPETIARAMDAMYYKGLEDAAELAWPTLPTVKTWSEQETQSLVAAHNRAEQRGKGWYESIYAVGAAARKDVASAIRSLKGE